jgi:putative transposase
MANTYTQIHIHVVFAVKYRIALINPKWEGDLYRYITGIIQSQGHKVLQINGMPDHIHILIGMRPNQSLSELIRSTKSRSTEWINANHKEVAHFLWQKGYGAFSLSREDIPRVATYIRNQKKHHMNTSFDDEFIQLLNDCKIEFDEKFLLKSANRR